MELDIQEALNDWRTINSDQRRWARFDALQSRNERVVHVEWGVVHSDGSKECAIQTICYSLRKDGTVAVTKHTHF